MLRTLICVSLIIIMIAGCKPDKYQVTLPQYKYGNSRLDLLVGSDSFQVRDTWSADSGLQYDRVSWTQTDTNEYILNETTIWDNNRLVACVLPYYGAGLGIHALDSVRSHIVVGWYSRTSQQANYGPVKGAILVTHDSTDYIEGTIDATIWNSYDSVNLSFTGSFKVMR